MQRRPSEFGSEGEPVEVEVDPAASGSPEPVSVRVSGESAVPSVQVYRLVRFAAASAATGDQVAAGVAAEVGLVAADPAAAARPLMAELPWGSAVACPA